MIDDLVEICHGAPFDEDVYIFDDLDAMRALHAAQAAALPLRPHARRRPPFTSWRDAHRRRPLRRRSGHSATDDIAFLVNCGAVGQPRDGDPRAAFGILDTEDTDAVAYARRLRRAAAQAKILAAGLPDVLAQRLGGWTVTELPRSTRDAIAVILAWPHA